MHRSTIPPHPSLPRPPPHPAAYTSPTYYCGSHYVQAYHPQTVVNPIPSPSMYTSGSTIPSNNGNKTHSHLMSTWYQPGSTRCFHPGCKFVGSNRSVEIHMMDRHLIFPPGWDKRKKSEWDADPSLKGKLIPIQGTNVVLDTPELINAWIAERKKRFPFSARVEEKKRKMEEAVARGQLDLTETRGTRPQKRRKTTKVTRAASGRTLSGQSSSLGTRKHELSNPHISFPQRTEMARVPPSQDVHRETKLMPEQDSADDDDTPEELPSKLREPDEEVVVDTMLHPQASAKRSPERTRKPQPRGPPKNSFASRPTLLRNLLLPEIGMTVSNLSQAIHFLVDNDFLHNVELKPGQADEQHKIHVLSSSQEIHDSRPQMSITKS